MKDFIKGMGSAIDMFPNKKNSGINVTIKSTDEAIQDAWQEVGNQIRSAMGRVDKEL